MSQRAFEFVVVLILFFNVEIFSQTKVQNINIQANYNPLLNRFSTTNARLKNLQQNTPYFLTKNKYDFQEFSIKQPIPGSFYADCLGFICKKEYQLQKISFVPFRFRLGSLAYVNYLEQKPNSTLAQP